MGLRSVRENRELACQLHRHIFTNPSAHPGTEGFIEVVDFHRVDDAWRVTVSLGSQSESIATTLVADQSLKWPNVAA